MQDRRRVFHISDDCIFESARLEGVEGGELSQPCSQQVSESRWRVDRIAALDAIRRQLAIDAAVPLAVPVEMPSKSVQPERLRPTQHLLDPYCGTAVALQQEIEGFATLLRLPDAKEDTITVSRKIDELHRRVSWLQPSAISEISDRIELTRRAAEQWRSDRETIAKTVGANNETMKEIVKLTKFLRDEVEPSLGAIVDTSEELTTLAPLYAEAIARSSQIEFLANPSLVSGMRNRLADVGDSVQELVTAISTSQEALRASVHALHLRRKNLV